MNFSTVLSCELTDHCPVSNGGVWEEVIIHRATHLIWLMKSLLL